MKAFAREGDLSRSLLDFISQDGQRQVVVLEAFIDESGTHASSILTVAAVVGGHYQWKFFLELWGNRIFHAKDPGSESLKPELFSAFEKAALTGFTAWVDPKVYRAAMRQENRSVFGNAYAICAFASAMGVTKFARQHQLGQTAFVIERGQPNTEYIRETLEYERTRERCQIATVTPASKTDFVQLGIADFLANSRTSHPEWFARFYDTGRTHDYELTAAKMEKLQSTFEPKKHAIRKLQAIHKNAKRKERRQQS